MRYGPFIRVKSVGENEAVCEIVDIKDITDYKKVKGILHWVSEEDAVDCEVREY